MDFWFDSPTWKKKKKSHLAEGRSLSPPLQSWPFVGWVEAATKCVADIITLGVSLLSGNGLRTAAGGDRDENRDNSTAGCVGLSDNVSRPSTSFYEICLYRCWFSFWMITTSGFCYMCWNKCLSSPETFVGAQLKTSSTVFVENNFLGNSWLLMYYRRIVVTCRGKDASLLELLSCFAELTGGLYWKQWSGAG